jgi:3-phosphoshikimate 1-carboxyvinyltransferase
MSIIGCLAEGETRLVNVAQARIKETDRIKVMTEELKKLGADVKELDDGMVIKHSKFKGTRLNGYHDHRVIMALSLAGMTADGETVIDTAESIGVTFPDYINKMNILGAKFKLV